MLTVQRIGHSRFFALVLVQKIVLFFGLHLTQQALLQDTLFFQVMSFPLVPGNSRLNCGGTRLKAAVIGSGLGQLLVDPGIGRVAIRGFVAHRLALLLGNGCQGVCNFLVHFLHQRVSGLVLGKQFGAF